MLNAPDDCGKQRRVPTGDFRKRTNRCEATVDSDFPLGEVRRAQQCADIAFDNGRKFGRVCSEFQPWGLGGWHEHDGEFVPRFWYRWRDHRPVLAAFKVQWRIIMGAAEGREEVAKESGLADVFNIQADFACVDFILYRPSCKVRAADGAGFEAFS